MWPAQILAGNLWLIQHQDGPNVGGLLLLPIYFMCYSCCVSIILRQITSHCSRLPHPESNVRIRSLNDLKRSLACTILSLTVLRTALQAVGATTPAFTALLGWLLYSQLESKRVYCALIPVVAGIVITSGFEPSFHATGLMFCIGATCARAYKSLLQVCRPQASLLIWNCAVFSN